MIVYVPSDPLPESEFTFLPPEALGGEVLEGDLRIGVRVDYQEGNLTGGIFAAFGQGRALVTLPFTEHATVFYGTVTMTDETGQRHVYRPGDSYLIHQGTQILWEQNCPVLQKSFFNIMAP